MVLKAELYSKVVLGDSAGVKTLTERAIEEGYDAADLLRDVLSAAMREVGERFERGEFFVPEMLLAARAMKAGVEVLRPHCVDGGLPSTGTVVIGTVAGDLHDIGKNLVVMMLEGAGFAVIDMGINVAPGAFVDAVRRHCPEIVGMSALLTTTMASMETIIEALTEAGLRDRVIVMVGGAPVSQRYADHIAADLYAADASSAARKAKEAVVQRKRT